MVKYNKEEFELWLINLKVYSIGREHLTLEEEHKLEDVRMSKADQMYQMVKKDREYKDLQLQIEKLKDDVQYWMKRANANGYRTLDRRNDEDNN